MTRNMRLVALGAALVALVLALVFGPVFAGYVFAGVAFGTIFVLMGMAAARRLGDWRLNHPWKLH